MKRIICDRCKAEYAPAPDWAQAPEFEYRVRYYYYGGATYRTVTLDLCQDCQKDLDKFIKAKSTIQKGDTTDD